VEIRNSLAKTFENWEATILRPIVTSLSTAVILFTVALLNGQFRNLVFPKEVIRDYPLICRAEPYLTEDGIFAVDFFIISRSEEDYSKEKLIRFLTEQKLDPASSPQPKIELKYIRKVGSIASAAEDRHFNEGKGELGVEYTPEHVAIDVRRIAARAVMKVVVFMKGLEDKPNNRMTPSAVPFDFEQYQDACYQR